MSNLAQRVFLMRNVHDDAPVLFQHALGALLPARPADARGDRAADTGDGQAGPRHRPLDGIGAASAADSESTRQSASTSARAPGPTTGTRPVVQHGVAERFLVSSNASTPPHYVARLGARVRAHYVDSKAGLDTWQTRYYLAPLTADGPDWSQAEIVAEPGPQFVSEPAAGATFGDAPAAALSAREYKRWAAALEDHVYRSDALELLRARRSRPPPLRA